MMVSSSGGAIRPPPAASATPATWNQNPYAQPNPQHSMPYHPYPPQHQYPASPSFNNAMGHHPQYSPQQGAGTENPPPGPYMYPAMPSQYAQHLPPYGHQAHPASAHHPPPPATTTQQDVVAATNPAEETTAAVTSPPSREPNPDAAPIASHPGDSETRETNATDSNAKSGEV